jgi:hypothetical protein
MVLSGGDEGWVDWYWENQEENRVCGGCWRGRPAWTWRRESIEDRVGRGKEVMECGGEREAVGRVDRVRLEKKGGCLSSGRCALGGIAIGVLMASWRSCSRCDIPVT